MHEILKNKKVILFDVGYTLDYPPTGDWMLTKRFYEIAGARFSACSQEDVIRAMETAFDYLAANHLVLTKELEAEQMTTYYTILSDELGLHLSQEEARAIAEDRTYNMSNYVLYPDAPAVLEKLSQQYKLGVVSDTWPSIVDQLITFGIIDYFSTFTYSCDLGILKPDPGMYLDALAKCGCAAEEAVFIDDKPMNLDGAAKLGITPILIAANPASDVETPYTKIHSLSELCGSELMG